MIPPDRPVQENEEIEITPEMIEAGVGALLMRCPNSATGDVTDQRMVAEIYEVMVSKAGLAARGLAS